MLHSKMIEMTHFACHCFCIMAALCKNGF